MNIFLAITIGSLFGFVLHRIGASNPENISNMLRLKDLTLMKTILSGIGIACFLLFFSIHFDFINVNHISIKSLNYGVLVGGLIFGLGWGISGYCPGTALAAIGERRKDALFFVLGGLLGAFLYMITFKFIKKSFLFESLLGGKVTLLQIPGDKYEHLININILFAATAIAFIFLFIAYKLPQKLN